MRHGVWALMLCILLSVVCSEVTAQSAAQRLAEARQAAAAAPKDPVAAFGLGKAAEATGALEQAVAAYQRALQLRPDFPEALTALGDVSYKQGDWSQAISYYEQALRSDPRLAAAHAGLGDVYRRNGAWAKAIEHYQAAVALDPKDVLSRGYLEACRRALDDQARGVVKADTFRGLARVEAEVRLRAEEASGRGLEVRRREEPLEPRTIPFHVPFPRDKWALEDLSASARAQLDEVAAVLISPEWKTARPLRLEGHACSCGPLAFNDALGKKRAETVRKYLIEKKAVAPEEVEVVSYGERKPVAPGKDEDLPYESCQRNDVHNQNRRVVIAERRPPGAEAEVGFWWRPAGDKGPFLRLADGATLHSGDEVAISLRPLKRGYMYVFHFGSAMDWAVLFPNPALKPSGSAANPLQAGQEYWIPGPGLALVLDKQPGREKTLVFWSPEPDPDLERAVNEILSSRPSQPGSGPVGEAKPGGGDKQSPRRTDPAPPAQKSREEQLQQAITEAQKTPRPETKADVGRTRPEEPSRREDISNRFRGFEALPATKLGNTFLTGKKACARVEFEHRP